MKMKNSFGFVLIAFMFLRTISLTWSFQFCHEYERQALLKFQQGVVDTENRLSSWVIKDCCKWKGVTCDDQTGHVAKLDLRNPDSTDVWLKLNEVNPSILELKRLSYLDLSGVDLSDTKTASFPSNLVLLDLSNCMLNNSSLLFHSLENLSSLLILDLAHNSIPGPIPPEMFGVLPNLKELYLNVNNLTGSIPEALGNLSKLEVLDLANNRLKGFIPSSLGSISMLRLLHLNYNQLNGEIPESLGQLTSLRELHLSSNQLSGSIPMSLGRLPLLRVLRLDYNLFNSNIPASFGGLSNLTELDIRSNQLSGPIPVLLGRLSNLEILRLSANRLNGTIPRALGQLSKLTSLDLSFNSLTGVVSEIHFAKLSKLKMLKMSSNHLSLNLPVDWVAPFELEAIHLGSCILGPNFPNWLQTQTEILFLNMSNAGISDRIPNWFKKLPSQLFVLDISHNQISDRIPDFTMPISSNFYLYLGSNAFTGFFPRFPTNTTVLDVSNNNLTGTIPKEIGLLLPKLIFLGLSSNHLNGIIPTSICKLKMLTYLDLSKNQLSGNLPQCWNNFYMLQVLDLTSNNLSGTIPSSIFQSPSLISLYLSNNEFSGVLPSDLHLTALKVLDIGENKLSGDLSSLLVEEHLPSVKILRLRSNFFHGSISPKICQLNGLQILDVAYNNLSGTIPHCFYHFSAMKQIISNLQDFDTSSIYEGELKQVIKGREREYIKILGLLVNLDLSNNNFVGQIPEEFTSLIGLRGLNVGNNQLSGIIPKEIGKMESIESLDFSRNNLSGTIPQSISSVSSLSYLNVSYNHLSGPIPRGTQLDTMNASLFEGNSELCGPPLTKICKLPTLPDDNKGEEEEGEFGATWFYIGLASGSAAGFSGVCGVLVIMKSWRYSYFRYVDDLTDVLAGRYRNSWSK
ncbi:hypothetical protein ACHQM5_026943 [Ranunculus cassubicifolius]